MIERYTRERMGQIWAPENRFQKMLEVEIAVAQAQAELGLIAKAAAKAIQTKGNFSVKRIHQIEKTTKHDVIAFVSAVAEKVGPHGRYIHYGMTSSDVLDTALSLQIKDGFNELNKSLDQYEKALEKVVKKHAGTLCAGRTHGMHAEPTSLGLKFAGFLEELRRHRLRLDQAEKQICIGKLSGAVGTYSTQPDSVEKRVCQLLKLTREQIATQVIPRDRHAEVFFALSMIGAGLERLSVELRHLQRTEVGEVIEGFSKGQKGSSAMPHKKNPISAENITGAARMLRSFLQSSMENIALWHERDISHSSVERVIFPDAFILADYAVDRMARVVDGLMVDEKRMAQNMELSKGQLYSSHVLLALVEKGLSREEAYKHVQRVSHSLNGKESLEEKMLVDKEISRLLKAKDLRKIFSGETHRKAIQKVIKKVKLNHIRR